MARPWTHWMVVICLPLALGKAGLAEELETDANIVTGIDISDSMDAQSIELEIDGMIQAILSREVLSAIRNGSTGRIGFAAFAWHHHRYAFVDWTIVATEQDARDVARKLGERLLVNVEAEVRLEGPNQIGRLTDLSRAIDYAWEMVQSAPFSGARSVVNIVGNGRDNMGEEARFARNRIVADGGTINGIVLGGDPQLAAYFREQVIGGPGAFLLPAYDATALVEAMRKKFVYDIAMEAPTDRQE